MNSKLIEQFIKNGKMLSFYHNKQKVEKSMWFTHTRPLIFKYREFHKLL